MDKRRLELFSLSLSRLRLTAHLLKKGRFKNAYNYLYATAMTRDAGLALADPLIRARHSLRPYPRAIEIEVTTRCNLRCTICEHTYWGERGKDLTYDQFVRIIDQFPQLAWVGITGIGEQFLNKDFIRMLALLKERGIFVEFFNGAHLLTPDIARELVRMGVDKIWISMEAATAETYEKIRVGAKFDKVLSNIRGLFKAKEELGSAVPEIWFHYIINTLNVQEMPQYVDLVADLVGARGNYATLIFWTGLLSFPEVDHLVVDQVPEEIRQEVARRTGQQGIYSNWNQNTAALESVCNCTRWTEPFILASGHVQPCCAINEANQREYQRQTAFADLLEEDFQDVWRSTRYEHFLARIRQGRFPEPCQNCRLFVEER